MNPRKDSQLSRSRLAASQKRSCSKSFAQYCVALLGCLSTVHAAPISASLSSLRKHPSERDGSQLSIPNQGVIHTRRISNATNNLQLTHRLFARIDDRPSLNSAATAVGICGGLAFLLAILGGFFYIRSDRIKHSRGKCKCGEKGIRCRYQRVPEDCSTHNRTRSAGGESEEISDVVQSRSLTPPSSSPRQSFLSGLLRQRPQPKPIVSFELPTEYSSSEAPFYDVESFEYLNQYKPPPSSYRSQTPTTSRDRLVPPSISRLLSPVSPLLSHQRFNPDVSITPPRTPSPAGYPKPSPLTQQLRNSHLRGRSLSAVDLSRSDGELQEDLTAIVRELQRRPRANSLEGRRDRSSGGSQDGQQQTDIMELEASFGMWDDEEQRNKSVVHEAAGEDFAVELDSRPLTLGLRRTKRIAGRFR